MSAMRICLDVDHTYGKIGTRFCQWTDKVEFPDCMASFMNSFSTTKPGVRTRTVCFTRQSHRDCARERQRV
eukprot:6180573-Pleurochrysis_carterae.AAC.1